MSKAYLNNLFEEGTRRELFEWLCRLDKENDKLREMLRAKGVSQETINRVLKAP